MSEISYKINSILFGMNSVTLWKFIGNLMVLLSMKEIQQQANINFDATLERKNIGNKIHACSIKYVENPHDLHDYFNDIIDYQEELAEVAEEFAPDYEINWNPIGNCLNSQESSELLAMYGDQ